MRAGKRLHCGPVCEQSSQRNGADSRGLGAAVGDRSCSVGRWRLAQDRRESEAALTAVRKEIKELQERIARETTRRDEGARALRAAEVEIAAATRKLAEVRGNVQSNKRRGAISRKRPSERIAVSRPRKPRSRAKCARAT